MIATPEALALVAAVVLLLPPWLVLRDLLGHPAAAWSGAGRCRPAWAVVVVLLPVLGPALYLRVVRPDLRDAPSRRGGASRAPVP